LQDSFAIYKAVRDSTGAVIDFAVEHLNDAACADTGHTREAQVGRTLGYLDPGYLESETFEWHRKALESDGPALLDELTYERRPEGRRLAKAYELRAVPVGGDRLAVTWRDITTRRLKEDELVLESTVLNRNVRAAAAGLPLSLFTLDRSLRYTWALEGGHARQLIGQTDEELFGREVARRLTPIYERALEGIPVRGEVELDLPEGRVTLDLAVAPLRDEDGRIVGIAGASYDLEPAAAQRRWVSATTR
jgi:PAS domain-containing protein